MILYNQNKRNDTLFNEFDEEIKILEFVFYIEYYYRNSNLNLDKINLEEISNINYKRPNFPLYIYSQIENSEQDINIFFKFNDILLKDKSIIKRFVYFTFDYRKKTNISKFIKNKQNYLIKF